MPAANPAIYAPFDGDGRIKAVPPETATRGRPIKVSAAMCRVLIASFNETGVHYSATGGTLWVVEEWCKRHDVKYSIEERTFGGVPSWALHRE